MWSEGGLEHRRLRAPHADGQRLVEPPLESAAEMVASNTRLRVATDYDLGGRSWNELASAARSQLLDSARSYLRFPAETRRSDQTERPLLLSGHQPELYHPGVWFKNFVLAHLARELDAHPVVLLVDNDLARSHSVRVPTGSIEHPRIAPIDIDRSSDVVPHEERPIIDANFFDTFGQRVTHTLASFIHEPLVRELWRSAAVARQHYDRLGECLAAIRRDAERRWGIQNLELPLSRVCEQEPFYWFMVHLIDRLPEFREIHNTSLLDYRTANRVRSQTHPVPALQADDDWLEAPFWVWTETTPQRRPLFVRRQGREVDLSDHGALRWRITIGDGGNVERAVDQLLNSTNRPKLRPRALITTMYARLFLSDLFVHGIGGAKYDQLTDLLIQRFFGTPGPGFLVATATAKLPIQRPEVGCDRLDEIQSQLRRMYFQPDQFVEPTRESSSLADAKCRWINTQLPRGSRKQRHLEITRINESLRPMVEAQRQQLLLEQQRLLTSCRSEGLLGSREYSFCLFPEKTLQALLLDF